MIQLSAGLLILGISSIAAGRPAAPPRRPFVVTVLDAGTYRGVPLVELRTVSNIRFITDSSGKAAIDEPAMDGQRAFFSVTSHGYEYPNDSFGNHGVTLLVKPGGRATIRLPRINIAERLYRITGEDIYRDSVLAGLGSPIRRPLLNAQVVGQDSVLNTIYHGRVFWVWGDTSRISYPLGNFNSTAATSLLPRDGGLPPDRGVDLDYFTDSSGFVKGIAPIAGSGPTWLGALMSLRDGAAERLFAAYSKVRQDMSPYQQGLVEFDDAAGQFHEVARFDMGTPITPRGHPFAVHEKGVDYLYFAFPYPLIRVPAGAAAVKDLARYEAFTCLKEGSRFDPSHPERALLDRDGAGRIRYAWKHDTPPVGPGEQDRLIKAGLMKKDEALLQLQDVESGKPVYAHSGSVYWNHYLNRWVMITVALGGHSLLGEVWLAEAPSPLGPWIYARKVVTHDRYSFYNPKQDPFFDQEKGRIIYFEGTYSATFSGNTDPTPLYDYNQMMYRLDLADGRLALPIPVGAAAASLLAPGSGSFCAPDRPGPGLVPVYRLVLADGKPKLATEPVGHARKPLFFALPPSAAPSASSTEPVYELVADSSGARQYTVDADTPPGYHRLPQPFCYVWKNPCQAPLPAP